MRRALRTASNAAAVERCAICRWARLSFSSAEQPYIALDQTGFRGDGHAAQSHAEGECAGIHRAPAGHPDVFGVLDHGHSGTRGGGQRLVHDGVAQDRLAVIAHSNGARGLERAIFCKRLAHAAPRRRGDGENACARATLGALHPAGCLDRVVDRHGIGHGADAGKAARGRGRRAGGDGFLVTLTRLAQVHVDVDQPRRHHQSGGFQDLCILLLRRGVQFSRRFDRCHAPVLEQEVPGGIDSSRGIDQMAAANQNCFQGLPPFRGALVP